MSSATYGQTLRRTAQELDDLRKQRSQLDARIARLEHLELALRGVFDSRQKKVADLSSITEVVRSVFKSASQPLTPPQVRDEMLAMGFDKEPYSQFLATVHVILKRLSKNDEVLEFVFSDKKTYWWTTRQMPGGALPENEMLGKYYNSLKKEDLKTAKSHRESRYKGRA